MTEAAGRRPTPSNLFSFSRVKTFAQCPLRYHYRYLEGLREAFRSVESFLGSTVHEVLEWLYRERGERSDPSAGAMHEEYARRWSDGLGADIAVVRVGEPADGYYALGREMLEGFYGGVFARDRSTTVALEQRVSLRVSDRVAFTGFADRVGRTETGRLFVIDYKTSRSEGDASDLSEGLQAPLYAACLLERHGDDEAVAGYHYLRHGTTRWLPVRRTGTSELWRRFALLAEEALTATDHPPRPGVLCAWCGFNARCPAAAVPEGLTGGLQHTLDARDGGSV